MRKTALLLLVIASQSLAQSPTQPKQEPERKAGGEPRLNLKLDESDLRSLSRSTSGPPAPTEEKSADGLPVLGGDARKFEPPAPSSDTRRPYPSDSQMISR